MATKKYRVAFGVKGKKNAVFNVKRCGMIEYDYTKTKPYTVGFWTKKKKGNKHLWKWVEFGAKDTANCDPIRK